MQKITWEVPVTQTLLDWPDKNWLKLDIFIVNIFLKNLPLSLFQGGPNQRKVLPRIEKGEMRKFGSLGFWRENCRLEKFFARTQVILANQLLKHCPSYRVKFGKIRQSINSFTLQKA